MIKNYFKMAWRNLMKHKFISFINLFGLTIGLTCCLLITVYILHETSFDKYNTKADRIYRVTRSFNNKDGAVTLRLGTVAPPFGPLLQNYFPEITKMTRLLNNGGTVRYEEKIFNEDNMYFADENLVDIFSVDVTRGNPQKALMDPFTVMLSETVAKKYFGNQDPMNKVIRVNDRINLKVTGIYKSFPSNAHIHPEIMASFNTLKDSTLYGQANLQNNYGNNSFFTYILLPENYDTKRMEARLPEFLNSRVQLGGMPTGVKTSDATSLGLQKLTDIHLRSHLDLEAEVNGDISRVYIFSIIALIILLIACINYMNLSTARSTLRAKEIGIRKVAGATKKELIAQFLSESVLISLLAMVIAIALMQLILPWLNTLAGFSLSASVLLNWYCIPLILLVPFVVGIISGIYPALFMSSFQPVKTLKGLFRVGKSSISFRQGLVVMQFTISIVLIITTAIVFQQLRYMQKATLGYNKEHIVILPQPFRTNEQYESFRNELLLNTNITNISRTSRIPTGRLLDSQNAAVVEGDSLQPVNSELKFLGADHDFITTYGIKMAAGRNYSRDFGTDTSNFIINEATVQVLGWGSPAKAIGKDLRYGGVRGKIIGVMQDFHFESMHQKIVPVVLVLVKPERVASFHYISVKINGNNITDALRSVEKIWKTRVPETPYQFNFLDERFQQQYESEQKQGNLFTIFSLIAICIACLGLLGLSSFAITQRIKEIGIRKVLGAGSGTIVLLLSKDFLKLVAIAALIAFPVAWYAMHQWLSDFAYRISISWWIFIVAGIIASLVALLTISIQAIKAATANPVKCLRTE